MAEESNDLDLHAETIAPPPPTDPPRPLTPAARRRCWTEPHVRFAWASGMVVLAIGIYFTLSGWRTWRHEQMLVEHGVPVSASIVEVTYLGQEIRLAGKSFDPSNLVRIEFPWNGTDHTTTSTTATGHVGFVTVGQTIAARVNPDDPDDWTELTAAEPLLHRILGGLIPLPIAAAAFGVSILMHDRMARTWRNGLPVACLVIESRHSALAPQSRMIRCTPATEGDERLFTVYAPARGGGRRLREGDSLWVIASPTGANQAIAVAE